MVNSLKAFIQWQSTLAWLKDPPSSYMLPPTDIEGGLDSISEKATSGGFGSEYAFQLAILKLIASAHDGHFAYRGDVFKAFVFRNSLVADIVSVSRDGKEVPKLYHLGKLCHSQCNSVYTDQVLTFLHSRPEEPDQPAGHRKDQRPGCSDPHRGPESAVHQLPGPRLAVERPVHQLRKRRCHHPPRRLDCPPERQRDRHLR